MQQPGLYIDILLRSTQRPASRTVWAGDVAGKEAARAGKPDIAP